MKLMKAIASAAAVIMMPALAVAAPEPTPPHDNGATGQSNPAASPSAKPKGMACAMMHDMPAADGNAVSHRQGNGPHQAPGTDTMSGMKCMHDRAGDVSTPAPAPTPAPKAQHDHDHSAQVPK